VIESVDETLSSLGEVVRNAVLEHLTNDFQINKDNIPQKIVDFSKIIHKVFGLGADRLELKIVKTLSSKLQVDLQLPEYDASMSKWVVNDIPFVDCLEKLRCNCIEVVEGSTQN
jgi:hypothetical protein